MYFLEYLFSYRRSLVFAGSSKGGHHLRQSIDVRTLNGAYRFSDRGHLVTVDSELFSCLAVPD